MELITGLIVEVLLDPVVLVATAAVALLLLSGLPARTIEAWENGARKRHVAHQR